MVWYWWRYSRRSGGRRLLSTGGARYPCCASPERRRGSWRGRQAMAAARRSPSLGRRHEPGAKRSRSVCTDVRTLYRWEPWWAMCFDVSFSALLTSSKAVGKAFESCLVIFQSKCLWQMCSFQIHSSGEVIWEGGTCAEGRRGGGKRDPSQGWTRKAFIKKLKATGT